MGALLQDLRYGLRMLAKSPGFTAVAVITLALGIGANTALFSVVNAVLLRPLPFPQPDRLVSVVSMLLGTNTNGDASYPDFADWRTRNHVFDGMAAFRTDNYTLTGAGAPLHLRVIVGSAELLKVLEAKPALGRSFLPSEDAPGSLNGTNAVILSYGLWQRHFGSDRHVLGRTINLNDQPYTVVGVMPASFQFPPIQSESADLWTTMAPDLKPLGGGMSMASQRGAHYLDVIARLRPNVTVDQAQAEMNTIVGALNKQYPENKPRGVKVIPVLNLLVGSASTALWVLLGAVGCVLLIACANVANLLLARAATRQKEMAIRTALGATRGRVVRQVLTESVLLAFSGGALGTLSAVWGIEFLKYLIPRDIPRIEQIGLDGRVLTFAITLSLVTGILFGLIPAFKSSRTMLVESLKEGGRRSTEGERHSRMRGVLVAGEVAVAFCLLIGAGLLIRSFLRLENVEPGFDPHHVLTFNLVLPSRYSQAQRIDFFQQAVTRIETLPGVRSASAAVPLPLDGDTVDTSFNVEGQPSAPDNPDTDYSFVEPGYFHTMGITLLKGRDFTWRDDLKSPPVIVINQTLARRFFPGADPIGKHLNAHIGNGYSKSPMREIVGVVQDVRNHGLNAAPGSQVYVPLAQSPLDVMTFVVRTAVDPSSLATAARGEIQALDKDLPLFGVKTLDDYVGQSIAQPRFDTLLLGLFGGMALALAMVGIYGVVSYSVTQRTHEMGIRMALGAQREDVLRLVVGQGVALALIGIGIGLTGAFALTRFLAGLLYGVRATDPPTFAMVSLLLVSVALAACYIPARRATKVDPMVALRYE